MIIVKRILGVFSSRERIAFFAAAAAAVASGLALAALAYYRATVPAPAAGGEYVEGIVGQPRAINPVLAASETDRFLVRLIFNNLAELADTIETNDDGRLWTIRLKEGLVWSDGKKLTSDDVIFTIERIQDPDGQSPLFPNWQGVQASRASELEIQFKLPSPYAFFSDVLRALYILPKHLFADVPVSNWRFSEYLLMPIGSGPYRFASYEREATGFVTAYRLEANPRANGAHPFIKKLIVRFYTDIRDLTRAFNKGSIDGFATLDPETAALAQRSHQLMSFRVSSYYAVFLNQTQFMPFKEREVREALNVATPREAIVRQVFGSSATPLAGPLTPASAGGEAEAETQAAGLLDQAGWRVGQDGVRTKPLRGSKVRLTFNLVVPKVSFLLTAAEILTAAWRRAGMEARIVPLTLEEVGETAIKNRDYDALLFGNVAGPGGDLFSFWHSSARFYPGLNLSLYENKTADRLLGEIRRALDPEVRVALSKDLDNVIRSDHPAIFLFSPDLLFVASKRLKGIEGKTLGDVVDRALYIPQWYEKTARVLR